MHGVDNCDGQTGQRQYQDGENRPCRHGAGGFVDFLRGDVGQALAAVAYGAEQHHHVMDAAREDAANQNPEHAGHITELGRQHGAQQRASRSNGRKVVSEQHKFVGFDVVVSVRVFDRRGWTGVIQVQNFTGDVKPVEPVADGEDAQCGKDDRDGINAK